MGTADREEPQQPETQVTGRRRNGFFDGWGRWQALLVILSLYVGGVMIWEFFAEIAQRNYDPDFLALWSAGRAALGDVYKTATLAAIQAPWTHVPLPRPFPYPPTLLPFIRPFGMLPFPVALAAWTALGFGALLLSVRGRLRRPELIVVFMTMSVLYAAATGQTSLLLGAAIIWAVFELPSRPYAAGAALGLVAAIKPQLIMLAPLVLLTNRRGLTGFLVASISLVTLSVCLYGVEAWRAWIVSLEGFRAIVASTPLIARCNLSPAAALAAAGIAPILPAQVAFGLVGVALALLSWRRGAPPELRIVGLVLGSFLCSPYVMPYDAAIVAPAAVMMLRGSFWPAGLLLLIPGYIPWAGAIIVAAVVAAILGREALALRRSPWASAMA